jgi:hypothetical protein
MKMWRRKLTSTLGILLSSFLLAACATDSGMLSGNSYNDMGPVVNPPENHNGPENEKPCKDARGVPTSS